MVAFGSQHRKSEDSMCVCRALGAPDACVASRLRMPSCPTAKPVRQPGPSTTPADWLGTPRPRAPSRVEINRRVKVAHGPPPSEGFGTLTYLGPPSLRPQVRSFLLSFSSSTSPSNQKPHHEPLYRIVRARRLDTTALNTTSGRVDSLNRPLRPATDRQDSAGRANFQPTPRAIMSFSL